MRKALESRQDPFLAILDHRNTPTPDKNASPAQYNLGRRTRTRLPMLGRLLEPAMVNTDMAKEQKKFQTKGLALTV